MLPLPQLCRLAIAAGIVGVAIADTVGLLWIVLPGPGFFYADPRHALLAGLAGPGAALVVHSAAALVGIATGIAALAGLLPVRGIVIGASVQVAVFGIALQSALTLNVIGYLVAFAMPAVGLVLLIQLVRRYPRARSAGVVLLVLITGLLVLGREPVGHLAVTLATQLPPQLPTMLMTLLFVAISGSWATAAITAAGGTPAGTRATSWIVRHRVLFTLVAACCPLPYALARLSWLTPWPVLGGGDQLEMSLRIWGLLLSAGAWLGVVLTIGLIRPWGQVFPRWMPVLAGRRVPVSAAAVPGGVVAAALCCAAIPWLLAAGTTIPDQTIDPLVKAVVATVVFPCWLWGPSLALAVWGYVGHRNRTGSTARVLDAAPTG